MGADGGVGVTDSPRGAMQPAARCVHVARVSVRLGECVWGARPAAASDIPGIPPWKWVWPGGAPRQVERGPAPQPRPSGQAWATADPEAFAVEEGPPLLRRGVLAPGVPRPGF